MSIDIDILIKLGASVTDASTELSRLSDALSAPDEWWGTAADAAAARVALVRTQYRSLAEDLGALAAVLRDAAVSAVAVQCATTAGLPGAALAQWLGFDALLAAQIGRVHVTEVTAVATLARWAAASDAERGTMLATHPEELGNVDGIPAAVRDAANRHMLEVERARLVAETQRLHNELNGNIFGGILSNADAGLEQCAARLADIDALECVLSRGDRQLIVFDNTDGRATHAAVATGDIDTADRVALLVPGLGSSVRGDLAGMDAEFSDVITDAAERSGDDVAGVVWMGYDAPQPGWDLLDPSRSVVSGTAAREGGADLARLIESIPAESMTVIGHSYGSLTAAYALKLGAHANDLVTLGSPGVGLPGLTDPLGWLSPGVDVDRMSVLESATDPVADLGWFGGDPSMTAPAGPEFAHLSAQDSSGHSDYLTPGTTSAANVAAVIAGTPTTAASGYPDLGDAVRVVLGAIL